MALRNAVLAMLLDGESSGYDLAKAFNSSVANFWTATPQQVYRELDRMEAAGLLTARVIEQERRPNKRVYSLTEAGRATIADFTTDTPRPTAIRDDLLVQLQTLEHGDADAITKSVRERLDAAEDKLSQYERLRALILDGRTEEEFLASAARVGPYLTLDRGIAFERENVRWATHVLASLAARAAR